jgi:hypothetical protein
MKFLSTSLKISEILFRIISLNIKGSGFCYDHYKHHFDWDADRTSHFDAAR